MKHGKPAALLFGLLVLASRAHADPALATETRKVGDFRAVELRGTADVTIAIGKGTRVDVSGEPGLFPQVTTQSKDGVLVIDTHGRLPNHNHLRVAITVPDLVAATLSGTGDLRVTGVANAKLEAQLSGTGDLVVSGTTTTLRVTLSGAGDIRAKDLVAKTVAVDLGGTGEATVNATDAVDAHLSGTGEISIYGHPPQVRKSVSGTGEVHLH